MQIRRELDTILTRIMYHSLYYNEQDSFQQIYVEYYKKEEGARLELLLKILAADGYINRISPDHLNEKRVFEPTDQGCKFIYLQGYVSTGRKEQRKRVFEWVKIAVVTIHGILLLWLTYKAIPQ